MCSSDLMLNMPGSERQAPDDAGDATADAGPFAPADTAGEPSPAAAAGKPSPAAAAGKPWPADTAGKPSPAAAAGKPSPAAAAGSSSPATAGAAGSPAPSDVSGASEPEAQGQLPPGTHGPPPTRQSTTMVFWLSVLAFVTIGALFSPDIRTDLRNASYLYLSFLFTATAIGLSCYLTAIAGPRQILPRGLRLVTLLLGVAGGLGQPPGDAVPANFIELQVAGQPPTLFGASALQFSHWGSPSTYEHFSALLTTLGPSNSHLVWAQDCGANRHISENLSDFKPDTLRAVNVNIGVAKAGVSMVARAVGDCDLHTFDQHNHPCVIHLKDVFYVPGVAKNLLSTYCLGQQGYQLVPEAKNPKFPPGLHLPRTPGQEDRYIPLHYVNGLAFIATRFDMQDSSGRMLTRSNKYLVFHKKLGFMPMSALRLTKQCVTGLEALHEAHFPGADYSDPAVKMGKMHHVDMQIGRAHV